MSNLREFDVAIIGAGIAGASLAYFVAPERRVLLLEREPQPGYHTTGRSAALFNDPFAQGAIRALTDASRSFYLNPPGGFADVPLNRSRAVLIFGQDRVALVESHRALRASGSNAELLDRERTLALVPVLRPECIESALLEPDCGDLDIGAIHGGFLRGLRAWGGALVCDADVSGLVQASGSWRISTSAGEFAAPIVVNAAGAWADEIARLAGVAPVGLRPLRRSAFLLPTDHDARNWPVVMAQDESFYFKPEAGQLFVSPANEDASFPHDVQPEELDIAIAVDRVQASTTLDVRRIGRRWAGLRSFVADRVMVTGFDPATPGFFWLAGQGGHGIQTAPGLARLATSLIRGEALSGELQAAGVEPGDLAPGRSGIQRIMAY